MYYVYRWLILCTDSTSLWPVLGAYWIKTHLISGMSRINLPRFSVMVRYSFHWVTRWTESSESAAACDYLPLLPFKRDSTRVTQSIQFPVLTRRSRIRRRIRLAHLHFESRVRHSPIKHINKVPSPYGRARERTTSGGRFQERWIHTHSLS
jgi:hypothetical protein